MLQYVKAINNYEKSNWNYCKKSVGKVIDWQTWRYEFISPELTQSKIDNKHSTSNSSKEWWRGFTTPALTRLSQADPWVSLVSQCCLTDEEILCLKTGCRVDEMSVGKMSWSQTWGPAFQLSDQYDGRGLSSDFQEHIVACATAPL